MTRRTGFIRAATVALTSLLVLGTAFGAGASPAQAAASDAPPFTAFSLNVAFDMSTARATSDAVKAMKVGSVGGFQEYSGRADREALLRASTARGFAVFMPDGNGVNVPIVWRKARFDLVTQQSLTVYGLQPGLSKARAINVVRLRDKLSGRLYGFVNTHTISGGASAAEPTGRTRKVSLLRYHLTRLRTVVARLSQDTRGVIAVGDWNVNYLADQRKQVAGFPTSRLGDLVNFDMPATGSRGATSLLDYVVSTKTARLDRVSSRIVAPFYSDHDAVATVYQPR